MMAIIINIDVMPAKRKRSVMEQKRSLAGLLAPFYGNCVVHATVKE